MSYFLFQHYPNSFIGLAFFCYVPLFPEEIKFALYGSGTNCQSSRQSNRQSLGCYISISLDGVTDNTLSLSQFILNKVPAIPDKVPAILRLCFLAFSPEGNGHIITIK